MNIEYGEIIFHGNTEKKLTYPDQSQYTQKYDKNSIFTFILDPGNDDDDEAKCKVEIVGINITLEHLDIDIDKGDFLLIGPGSKATHRELSRAQIISDNIFNEPDDHKRIWVNAEAAYIR